MIHTESLIREIERLPLPEQFFIMEELIKSIQRKSIQRKSIQRKSIQHGELNHQMQLAADELYDDYVNDKELIAFTALDMEDFYEARQAR
jgi:hypothetical protein